MTAEEKKKLEEEIEEHEKEEAKMAILKAKERFDFFDFIEGSF
jgi:hypothetical protein